MFYCVYVHINKINGKMYVGQTCQKPEKRWQNGGGYLNSTYFYHAIQKYGWDNFEHEIVASNLTQQEADNFERLLIEKLDTLNHDKGYNIRVGGANGRLTQEHKNKIAKGRSKPVYCVELDRIFPSGKAAAEELGLNRGNLSSCLNGKGYYSTCGGYHWKYTEVNN